MASTSLIKPQIPKLDGINYQEWSSTMKSYLSTLDLWLITGETNVNTRADRPVPAAAGAPTADETRDMCAWDTADHRAQGFLTLNITEGAKHRIMTAVGQNPTARLIWEQALALYGQVSPAKVYALFRKTRQWHLDASKHPQPQLDALDYLYEQLTSQTVQITDFLRAMTLLSALPPPWEESITTIVMQSGTITGITYDAAKTAVSRHWDALSARKAGKRPEKVSKISSIPRKGPTPSFQQQQTAPSQGSRSERTPYKKGKHGARGKGKGKEKACPQGYGKVHLVSTASPAQPRSHSIATVMPQGLLHRIAVEDPETSSYGNGPYASFNQAMTLAQRIGNRPSPRTVQALEEQVLSVPTLNNTLPTPSVASSDESRDEFGYTATELGAISSCFLPHKGIPYMVPEPDLTSEQMEDDEGISIPDDDDLFGDLH
jgi:hypothetical protein